MMKKLSGQSLAVGVFVVAALAAPSFAAPALVDNVYMAFGSNVTYFTGATQVFGFSALVATGQIQSEAAPSGTYDFLIKDATLTFNPDLLVADLSSGGIAKATFAGGGSISLVGDIVEISSGTKIYDNQTLMTAAMTIPGSETWLLEEQGFFVVGSVYFNPVSGVLVDGDQLNIGQFRLAFKAFPSPNPSDFTTNQTCLTQGIEITAVPIPEPATLVLLGLGGILLRRFRS